MSITDVKPAFSLPSMTSKGFSQAGLLRNRYINFEMLRDNFSQWNRMTRLGHKHSTSADLAIRDCHIEADVTGDPSKHYSSCKTSRISAKMAGSDTSAILRMIAVPPKA